MVVSIDRRGLMLGAAAMVLGEGAIVAAQEVVKEIADLAPGEFTWHPDRQPDGPVAVVVSLPEQRVHVYRNGIRIAVSTCSSGKPGHETPTGVFVVLQKDKNHHSSTYNDAPMPNMNRLTWSGIALHAGNLPGYPASHGCVRLPIAFSDKLFGVTHLGTPVIIAGSATDPWTLVHPGMVLAASSEERFRQAVATLDGKKPPSDWVGGETLASVIASTADGRIMLLQDGEVTKEGTLTFAGERSVGSHVFILQGEHESSQGMQWLAVSHSAGPGAASETGLIARLSADPDFVAAMSAQMHPGMMLVVTDVPLSPDRRSGKDFVIMS